MKRVESGQIKEPIKEKIWQRDEYKKFVESLESISTDKKSLSEQTITNQKPKTILVKTIEE